MSEFPELTGRKDWTTPLVGHVKPYPHSPLLTAPRNAGA